MPYEFIGYDDDDFGYSGAEYEDDGYGYSRGLELIGYEGDEAYAGYDEDAIAGADELDELIALAGFEPSPLEELLRVTAGRLPFIQGRGGRGAPRRGPPPRGSARQQAARATNVARRMGHALQRERAKTAVLTAHAMQGGPQMRGPMPMQRPMQQMPMQQGPGEIVRQVPSATGGMSQVVRQDGLARDIPIPLNSQRPVPAGGTETIVARPQVPLFRPKQLIIPSTTGVHFRILNMNIGMNGQFGANGDLPALVFSENARARFAWSTVQPGQDVVLQVQNMDGADHRFEGVLIGTAVT